ncbi:MAG: tyrosine-protein phosphatase [Bacillota bacterium]
MQFESIHNFRDLGGISTIDGKKIKSGLFFRSAMLDDATDSDIEKMKLLNIKQIFDYRDAGENTRLKRDVYKLIGVKHLNYEVGLNNDKLFKLQNGRSAIDALKGVKLEDVMETYRSLPFNNEGYRSMVTALKSDSLPLWQHCSAGKDRAGMGSALLLAILGVGYDEILADYMLSMQVRNYIRGVVAGHIPWGVRTLILSRLEPLYIVDKKLLDAAVTAIMDRYGNLEAYLLGEYNLDAQKLADLRAKYTE